VFIDTGAEANLCLRDIGPATHSLRSDTHILAAHSKADQIAPALSAAHPQARVGRRWLVLTYETA